jgi:hypothetical protein
VAGEDWAWYMDGMTTQSNGRIQNLRPWRPGQSGNPGGRPKTKLFKEALDAEIEKAGDDGPSLRKIARTLLNMAAAGDIQAIREVADRFDGKPTQVLEHNDGEGQPMRRIVCEIVHVHETREALERDDDPLLIEHQEEPPLTNGDGHNHGNGHDR